MIDTKQPLHLATKFQTYRDEFAVEKSTSVLMEYQSAVETITGSFAPFCLSYQAPSLLVVCNTLLVVF